MASEWRQATLRDAGVQLIDCDHRTPAAAESGYPYIAIPQLKDGRIDLSEVRRISAEDFADWTRKLRPKANDVIVVRRCKSGVSAVVPEGLECAIGQNLVVLRADGKSIYPPYLRWLVRGAEWWSEVNTYINVGAVFDSLKCKDIPHFRVLVPSIDKQREISGFLRALDDRIELLRQTNITLEAIAQALFKSWFVDFDPVRAKAEGREPEGMDAATAALFPSEFEASELGLIPKGWQIDEIGKVAPCVGGATPSTKEPRFWDDPVHHWVTPKDLSGLQAPVLIDTERKVSEAGLARISSGLLPIGTLLLSSRAPIGYLAIAHVPTAINQGFIAMLPGGQLPASYLLFWTKLNMDAIKQKANGSTFMEISKSAFRPIKLVVPSSRVVSEFDSICRPLLDRIAENERQRLQLAQLRDVLLPRLISGKMRLPEANAPMQAAQVARPNSVDR